MASFSSTVRRMSRFRSTVAAIVETMEGRQLLAGVLSEYAGQRVVVVEDALSNAPVVPILLNGVPQDQGDQIVVYHRNTALDWRQKLVLDTNGLLRLRHSDTDLPPGSEDPFGTSLKLPPGLILADNGGQHHYLSVRLSSIDVIANRIVELGLKVKGNPMDGNGRVLESVHLEWNITLRSTLVGDQQSLSIQTLFRTTQQVVLDPTAIANAEAFRSVMFSSSNVSPERTSLGVRTHDADQLVASTASGLVFRNLDFQSPNQLFFAGGLADTKTLALNQILPAPLNLDPPSIYASIDNPGAVKYRVQGYLTDGPEINENSDNLGVWLSREMTSNVIPSGAFYAWTTSFEASDNPQLNPKDDIAGWDHSLDRLRIKHLQDFGTSITQWPAPDPGDWKLYSGDFDNDGEQDLVARLSNGMWRFLKDGLYPSWGTWAADAVAGWQHVQVVDINGDGKDDILGQHANGQWWGRISTGTTFINTYFGRWTATGWVTLQTGDFNGDGRSDLAGLRPDGTWVIGINEGSRFATMYYGRWNATAGWSDFQVADLNGDGRADLIAKTATGAWWIASLLGPENTFRSTFAGPSLGADHLLADFTGDSFPDLVERDAAGNWWVSRNNGTGRLVGASIWGSSTPVAQWRFLVGDFDGNSIPDIATYQVSNQTWQFLASNGHKFFAIPLNFGNFFAAATDFFAGEFKLETFRP